MGKIKTFAILILCMACLTSIKLSGTLAGKYIYAGDIENGKKEAGPTDYTLLRNYDAAHFTAYVIQKGYKTEKYETGNYSLTIDTCFETQTWCSQPSKLLNIAVHYHYSFNKDTLVLKGILPNGTKVEEYWKRVK
jgi:hypothetical protein